MLKYHLLQEKLNTNYPYTQLHDTVSVLLNEILFLFVFLNKSFLSRATAYTHVLWYPFLYRATVCTCVFVISIQGHYIHMCSEIQHCAHSNLRECRLLISLLEKTTSFLLLIFTKLSTNWKQSCLCTQFLTIKTWEGVLWFI